MSFAGRWVELIYKVATGDWRARVILAPIVGTLYLSLIAFFVFLSLAVDQWLSLPRVSCSLSVAIGLFFIISGIFLTLFSTALFIRERGTPVPVSPPPKLIKTGPYRFARNPMLSGMFIQLFGLGIALGSLSLTLIFTPLFIIINVWELKKVEEPELLKRLGEPYAEYRKQVPMFFPFFVKRSEKKNDHNKCS
jgi:protein-S-isoprenylcysteine O-methyltransferase Ste14